MSGDDAATWHPLEVNAAIDPERASISLALPGRPEYGRVARVGAAHLAHRRGFTLTEIDDLRLAIDEAVIMLLGPSPRPGRIDIAYRVSPATVDVELVSRLDDGGDAPPVPAERVERFNDLAGELAEVTVDAADRRVRVIKNHVADA